MGRSKEDMQDIALHQMEKSNRWNKQPEKRLVSYQEQIAELERKKSLTPEQLNREKSYEDYVYELRLWMESRETSRKYNITFTGKFITWVTLAKKKEMAQFHSKGTVYSEMIPWLEDMKEVHMNL